MTRSQFQLFASVAITLFASSLWLWSYFAFPGAGFLRTLVLFVILFFTWRPFENEFRLVSQAQPLSKRLVQAVFLAWLVLLLAAVLAVLSMGLKIPVGRGPNRPIGFILLLAPLLGFAGLRLVHMYRWLGRSGT